MDPKCVDYSKKSKNKSKVNNSNNHQTNKARKLNYSRTEIEHRLIEWAWIF